MKKLLIDLAAQLIIIALDNDTIRGVVLPKLLKKYKIRELTK